MRLLFLLLVLVNGLVYLWFSADRQSVSAAPTDTDGKAARLVLLSESGRNFKAEDSGITSGDSVTDVGSRACFTLGPLMSRESVLEAGEKLNAAGLSFERRVSEKKEQIGYWVYLPPFATPEAAQEKAQEFRLLGDRHFYVVKPPSEYAYGISLGVFQDRKNAERRHRQIEGLGYNPLLEGRFRQNPVYWLDYVEAGDGEDFDNSGLPEAQIYPRVCETTIAENPPLP